MCNIKQKFLITCTTLKYINANVFACHWELHGMYWDKNTNCYLQNGYCKKKTQQHHKCTHIHTKSITKWVWCMQFLAVFKMVPNSHLQALLHLYNGCLCEFSVSLWDHSKKISKWFIPNNIVTQPSSLWFSMLLFHKQRYIMKFLNLWAC